MGIANPVTRDTHGSGTQYHIQLAKQLGDMLQAPLEVKKLCLYISNAYQVALHGQLHLYSTLQQFGVSKIFDWKKLGVNTFLYLKIYLLIHFLSDFWAVYYLCDIVNLAHHYLNIITLLEFNLQ